MKFLPFCNLYDKNINYVIRISFNLIIDFNYSKFSFKCICSLKHMTLLTCFKNYTLTFFIILIWAINSNVMSFNH